MTHGATTYRLLEGRGTMIQHFGEPLRLRPDAPLPRPERAGPAHTELHDLPHAA
jgi:hypothetical protein